MRPSSPRHRRPRQFGEDGEQPSAMLLPESLPQSTSRPPSETQSESSTGHISDQPMPDSQKDRPTIPARRYIITEMGMPLM